MSQLPVSPDTAEMPLVSHLIELRTRLMRVLGLLLVMFFSLVYFANDIYEWLSLPLRALLPAGSTMIATDVTSPFMAPFKLTFFVALFASIPYILVQIWGFIAPALYQNERRIAIPLVISSVLLFYAGIAFAYFITLPAILGFFTQIGPEGVAIMTDINLYLDFALKLFLVFGVTFEIPVAVLVLIVARVISCDSLADKRRYIIVGCFFVAMFITPPDALSMAMLAIPMWLLFETGLFFGRIIEKQRRQAAD
ncbi:twin-arginine translocase subunit TatC [Perlucidibaca piscinae]|uniref:twin-arginine translocase subunit TatC n=1 Tax=Perlucidibaca piscinae TaxID=392589 RepID=UPI0003B56C6A|nr:twin-arginine translocase subunit TatC [Perlucidibaca piscinae]